MTNSQRLLGTAAITGQQRGGLALFTDFYELTMLRAYLGHGMTDQAVFSLFVRKVPPGRNYLIACGVDDVLDPLESLVFTEEDIAYLSTQRAFAGSFLNRLTEFRFTGAFMRCRRERRSSRTSRFLRSLPRSERRN